jgi:hypothetical protein
MVRRLEPGGNGALDRPEFCLAGTFAADRVENLHTWLWTIPPPTQVTEPAVKRVRWRAGGNSPSRRESQVLIPSSYWPSK